MQLDEAYKNIMPMGRYFYYQLMPGKSGEDFGFLDTLTVNLESVIGDAELLVSYAKPLPRLEDPSNETFISR